MDTDTDTDTGTDMKARTVERFPWSYRIEHWLLVASFTALAITGLVQKYAEFGVSDWIIGLLGGVDNTRFAHHVAAATMIFLSVYHLAVVGYRVFVLRYRLSMLLESADIRAGLGWLKYNLGLSESRPLEGRYSFAEKIEYWALVWGTVLMAVTGFMLWNPIATARLVPGEFIPAAKMAHGYEAILAVLSVLVWHAYFVHLKAFNRSMFGGGLGEDEMAHEHPLELASIKAGTHHRPVSPAGVAARRRVYVPVCLIVVAILVGGLYSFMTFEETAIATAPPLEQVSAYSPLPATPLPSPLPSLTPMPAGQLVWVGGLADLLQRKCGACHNSSNPLGELDLSTYQGALTGGISGPGVVPGDPNASRTVVRQSTGDHPGQLSGDELALLRKWVEAGAPEQ